MSIIRELDRAKAKETGLELCEACGDYAGFTHRSRCRPELGRLADALASAALDMNPTRLGYGEHRVTFEIVEDLHVRFSVGRREVHLEALHALQDLSIDQAVNLTRSIAIAMRSAAMPRNESPLAIALADLLIAWQTGKSIRGVFESNVIALVRKFEVEQAPRTVEHPYRSMGQPHDEPECPGACTVPGCPNDVTDV